MRSVLYAEDSDGDAFLMKRAFAKVRARTPLVVVPDGRGAIAYLEGTSRYSDGNQFLPPSLVLLDVKMPYADGFEVLSWIRSQVAFQLIPVFMLTSSSQDKDIALASANGANGYLVKSTNLETFLEMVEDLISYSQNATKANGWMHVRGGVAKS